MVDRYWLIAATVVYLGSAAWGAFALGARRATSTPWNDSVLLIGFILNSIFLYERGKALGQCPLTNLFEVVAFINWSLVLTYLAIGPVYRMSILGAFTAPLVFLLNFLALVVPVDVPVSPHHLGWTLEAHAALTLIGFGMLGVAALAGLMYLIQEHQVKRRSLDNWFYSLPAMGRLETVHRLVLKWAFLLFSIGMLFGFFIPRQTAFDWVKVFWSAFVWLVYAVILLAPRLVHMSRKKAAWLSVTGYIFLLLTFWGINSLSQDHRFNNPVPAPSNPAPLATRHQEVFP
jgi:HemX protein